MHTKEPWSIRRNNVIDSKGDSLLVNGVSLPCGIHPKNDEALANAARIVACVNACAGINDPAAICELIEVAQDSLSFVKGYENRLSRTASDYRDADEAKLAAKCHDSLAAAIAKVSP